MLFIGPAGVGKTTVAHALAHELGWAIVELNASDERGIQVVREEIKSLAFSKGKKIILLDEADNMTEDAQQALRRIMEKAKDARFILTANFEWKIIDPIKSRCLILRFKKLPPDLVVRRLVEILIAEGVQVTQENLPQLREALSYIVEVTGGDMRKALNLLESAISTGLSVEAIKASVRPGFAEQAVNFAIKGDLDQAVAMMENVLVDTALDMDLVMNQFYKAISKISDPRIKTKALVELARAEHAIKMGGSPVIQLSAVLSVIWLTSLRR